MRDVCARVGVSSCMYWCKRLCSRSGLGTGGGAMALGQRARARGAEELERGGAKRSEEEEEEEEERGGGGR